MAIWDPRKGCRSYSEGCKFCYIHKDDRKRGINKESRVEINSLAEEHILAWLKIRESNELKNIHIKLCKELKEKFGVAPLGFDGEQWKFHSTLASSNVHESYKNELIYEYDNKDISIEFEAKEIVMFCCMGDGSKTSEYFSLKIFNIKNIQ